MKPQSPVDPFVQKISGDEGLQASCMRLLAMMLTSALLVWLLDPAVNTWGLLWRNALPAVLLFALIYGLCGRFLLSMLLGSAIGWMVFKVNAIKELNLQMPLMPGDLVLWRQTVDNIGFFSHYSGYRSILLLLAVLLMVGAVALVLWMEKRWQRPRWGSRSLWILVSVAMLMMLFHGVGFWRHLYSDKTLPGSIGYDPNQSVDQGGLIVTLVRLSQVQQVSLPAADKSLVVQFLHSHADVLKMRATRKAPTDLPDIVVVQSEAFFDPGVLKTVDFGQYAPNFERLAATGLTGALTTPTYGGGTIRTEFETLTGYPMGAFPDIEFPYFGLARSSMPTVPRRLMAAGYSTALFHPFKSDFWNRDEVMPELGFQKTHFENDFSGAARAGSFISDRALFDVVLAQLDKPSSVPRYTMVITMENHGPWDRDDALAGPLRGISLPRGLSPQGSQEMSYYLSHLLNGDTALADFVPRLLARPHWTILVFYGDHLPALSHAFDDLGFDDNGLAVNEHTRYMLLSNRPLSSGLPRKLDLHAYDLPGLIFDVTELPEDGYLGVASEIRLDRMQEHFQHDPEYSRLQFNAAKLEVSCNGKIGTSDKCGR